MAVPSVSRIGRKPITIPSGVEVKLQNKQLSVKGPKGQLSFDVHPYIQVGIENNEVSVQFVMSGTDKTITGASKKVYRAIAGTTRATISNMVQGVSKGYERKLTLVGVGYRAQSKGKVLSLSLGFSHPTDYELPVGVTAETPSQTEIILKGVDKERVGQAAAEIRSIRGPEPYKGKGVRYANETIELKETKKK